MQTKLLADAASIIGTVTNPLPDAYKNIGAAQGGGLVLFFSNVLRLVFVIAGIYAFINFIIAGFQYMSAAGDSKALSAAWDRIWQTWLGIVVIIASFAITAILSQLLFGNPTYILSPTIYGPN